MEILLKVGVTAIVLTLVYFQLVFLVSVWQSQIDAIATITRITEWLGPSSDLIATRDPRAIYQNAEVVGQVTGPVTIENDRVTFAELSNTANLDRNQPFEYRRTKLRIIEKGPSADFYISGTGAKPANNVIKNVVCEQLP